MSLSIQHHMRNDRYRYSASIGCICSHSNRFSTGHGHWTPTELSGTAVRWRCWPLALSFTPFATPYNVHSISWSTNGISWIRSNNLSTFARCRTFRCFYLLMMHMDITSMDGMLLWLPLNRSIECRKMTHFSCFFVCIASGHRTGLPIRTCAQCYSN